MLFAQIAFAADTTPRTINYQGRLLDNARQPITTQQTIRFSIWSNQDFVTGEIDGSGNINAGATNYANWQEEQSFTPDSYGIFSLQIGAVNPLPDMDYTIHKYLQVEIKPN